jgi:predicted nucleotidyltransferase
VAAARPLSRLEASLRRIAADLADLGRRWALVGALAVSARTEPRFTRDIDAAVGVEDDADAERLVHDLQARGYGVPSIVEQEATARLAAARLLPPGEAEAGIVLDLLFAAAGIEAELVAAAVTLEVLPGLSVPVASTGHLVALKVLARDDRTRPQDRVDLEALARIATPADLAEARSALALIEARGFHRGRDLGRELDRLLAERRR